MRQRVLAMIDAVPRPALALRCMGVVASFGIAMLANSQKLYKGDFYLQL